jgi:hypothetical protein
MFSGMLGNSWEREAMLQSFRPSWWPWAGWDGQRRNGARYRNTGQDQKRVDDILAKTYLKTASLMAKGARSAVVLGGCEKGEVWKDIAYA